MTSNDILAAQDHRPFELPKGKWRIRQTWHDLLFAHWPVEPERIAPYVPKQLELDLWDGAAWVSVSPFLVSPLSIRGLPTLPLARSFCELNMRTYVVYRGRPGVYFFSLDASSRLAVEAARLTGLPYFHAAISMKREKELILYACDRNDARMRSASFAGIYYPTSGEICHAEPDTRLHWLTERYRLYSVKRDGVMAIDIHHLPWPLQSAEWIADKNTMGEAWGIELPDVKPILTYSKFLDVLIWPMKMLN
ncbi:YqjF family protein [Cohnella fermenti]|uniref:DUF2071 domain-containing protein n=1 Tax=Cohnella fermenti TaxID=2565925 RepID=A0A4S4BM62_9BACL|nr:DUF2071 domain-containing protein [Cohnella fermenti]THF75706.1 DUF2071 domain-containing protein [Cohnella fermenti]